MGAVAGLPPGAGTMLLVPRTDAQAAQGRAPSPRTGPRAIPSLPRRPPAGQHSGSPRLTSAATLSPFPPRATSLDNRKVAARCRQGTGARVLAVPNGCSTGQGMATDPRTGPGLSLLP